MSASKLITKPFKANQARASSLPPCDINCFAPQIDENEFVVEEFLGEDMTVIKSRLTYFFDDGHCGGFLSIPHLGRHGSAATAGIARILERWLVEKTSNPAANTNIIPILQEPIQQVTSSILERLHLEGSKLITNLSKVAIKVTTGHIFTLDRCCDDESVQWAALQFQQDYPLFLDLTIFTSQRLTSLPRFYKNNYPTPYSATSYSCVNFNPHYATEILIHCEKINLNDD